MINSRGRNTVSAKKAALQLAKIDEQTVNEENQLRLEQEAAQIPILATDIPKDFIAQAFKNAVSIMKEIFIYFHKSLIVLN